MTVTEKTMSWSNKESKKRYKVGHVDGETYYMQYYNTLGGARNFIDKLVRDGIMPADIDLIKLVRTSDIRR